MKKIILSLSVVASCALAVFVSCKKETMIKSTTTTNTAQPENNNVNSKQGNTGNVNVNSAEVTSITSLPSIAAGLNSSQISGFDSGHKTSVDNSHWDIYELTKEVSSTEVVTLICIANTNKKIVMPYLFKTLKDNTGRIIQLSGEGLLNRVSTGIMVVNPKTGTLDRPTCPESTDNFNDCFHCAYNELTDDFLGTLACTIFPISCVAASALACAVFGGSAEFVFPGNNGRDIVNANDIQAFVNLSIQKGVFTTVIQENNTYLLN